MTRFEKDYQAAKDGDGIEVLTRRKKEHEALRKELRYCKNNFRAECLMQEIQKRQAEYRQIDELF
jgi:hypothetical protein